MGERHLYRTTIICVDSYQDSVLKGRLYASDLGYSDCFHSTVEFLKKMASLADHAMLPQAAYRPRVFRTPQESVMQPPPDALPHTGALSTFALRILFRQNASWQGSIFWLDEEQEEHFRSVLELIFLIDSTLSEHTKAPSVPSPADTPHEEDEEKDPDSLEQIELTQALISDFLKNAREKGLGDASVRTYRSALQMLYDFLPTGKCLNQTTAGTWKTAMEQQGLAAQTIHTRIYILNALLRYLDKESWTAERVSVTQSPQDRNQLTLEEYQLLVKTAESIGKQRAVLLMKTILTAGCRPQELHQLTVDALRSGSVTVTSYGTPRQLEIPASLCEELLSYADHKKIQGGAVFVTKDGNPLHHTVIWKEIKVVCRHAGIPEEKGNPSNFYRLYQSMNKA